jgi:CRISPR-associated protein Csm1
MNQSLVEFNTALQVIQQAVNILLEWADLGFTMKLSKLANDDAIKTAKSILSWHSDSKLEVLRLLFDSVKLLQGQSENYYWKPRKIEDKNPIIPYPWTQEPTPSDLENFKREIRKDIDFINESVIYEWMLID